MNVVILAGGLGTRLAEETDLLPKPLVHIGDRPILWHIMNHYATYDFSDFHIALGYKGELVKRYFRDYAQFSGSLTVDLATGEMTPRQPCPVNWTVHLEDTGRDTNTGGRLACLRDRLGDSTFMLTYGDGLSDLDLSRLLDFHRSHGCLATLTAVRPPARFGGLEFEGDLVTTFTEKPQVGEGWINGGFMVFEPGIFDHLGGQDSSLERHTLSRLVSTGQVAAYRHEGFWQCMDTLRDKRVLERLWASGTAPWSTNQ